MSDVAEFVVMVGCLSGVVFWCGVLFSELVARHDVQHIPTDQAVWRNSR